MEQFLIKNTARFESLVKAFVPPLDDEGSTPSSAPTTSDVIVCTRIRPLLEEELSCGFRAAIFPRRVANGWVDLHDLYNAPRGVPMSKSSKFRLDEVFGADATTDEIYDNVVKDLISFAWNGGIGTLFAYGQTGSGKTFTISRLEQLAIQTLLDGSLDGARKIYVTIIELAGNAAFDLLNARKPVSVLEDSFGATQVVGAQEHLATDVDEVTRLVEAANAFRRTAATEKNDQSSRSHAVCRIRIDTLQVPPAEDGILYLIDLAGSEAARDPDRRREALQINKSLSVLKDCIRGKAELDAMVASGQQQKKAKAYVPFRQSTLTKILKHLFDAASQRPCKTVVMACVNPSNADCAPSRNTLRYAEMLRVHVPAPKTVAFKPGVPSTWSNSQLRSWVDKNSGEIPISSQTLAPRESGLQLLKLTEPDFEARCMRTSGVTAEQAKAFRSKLWQMHVDSQHPRRSGPEQNDDVGSAEPDTILGHLKMASRSSSRDPDSQHHSVPFQQRIRPGMVVRCASGPWVPNSGQVKMVMILCPADAAGRHAKDFEGKLVNQQHGDSATASVPLDAPRQKYLCALVSPGTMAEAYEMSIWTQIVMDAAQMEAEVLMEYDSASRFYYITV